MISIQELKENTFWDEYVTNHPKANAYQVFAWQDIIKKTYGFKTFALAAFTGETNDSQVTPVSANRMVGLLPLVQIKTPLIGNRLVSMPYFDHGGVLSENTESENRLIEAAIRLGQKTGAKRIELRQLDRLPTLDNVDSRRLESPSAKGKISLHTIKRLNRQPVKVEWTLKSHKVRMLLPLPGNSGFLMKSFKSKLRSQIKRPIKAGLEAKIGGIELLDDFYYVFSMNMRDLGSPVHSNALPNNVLRRFGDKARIAVVYKGKAPLAASLMVGVNSVMNNPWASALREYSKDSPNMLLYWTMLSYASDRGYHYFDFGRSTPGEGTYKFKAQWGAQPHPMYWYTIHLDKHRPPNNHRNDTSISKKRAMAVQLWQKIPVSITRIIGPPIRKHIDL